MQKENSFFFADKTIFMSERPSFNFQNSENLVAKSLIDLHAYTKCSLLLDIQMITIFAAYTKPTLSLH